MTTAIATLEQHISNEVVCSVCGTGVSEKSIPCQVCETKYHPPCWEYNGGCATFGCMSPVAGQQQNGTELVPQKQKQDFTKTYVKPIHGALETLLEGTPHADEIAQATALYIAAKTHALEPPMVFRALETRLEKWKEHYRNRIKQTNSPELRHLIEHRHEIAKTLEGWKKKYIDVYDLHSNQLMAAIPHISYLPEDIPISANEDSKLIFSAIKELFHSFEVPIDFSYASLRECREYTPIPMVLGGYVGSTGCIGASVLLWTATAFSPPLSLLLAPIAICYTNTGGYLLELTDAGDTEAYKKIFEAYGNIVKKLNILHNNHNNPEITSLPSISKQR